MNEQTIELPQLSLAHYFDLLKRRRWQVIPISLLGLFIGGIVAFFVPRYYVAETYVDYYRLPSDVEARPAEDPFKFVVDNATILIPQAVGATAKKLGWAESAIADPSDRRQAEREIESRISVHDMNRGEGRSYARIVVSYRDRDGVKSAQFLNTLVATWMEQRVADMRRTIALQSQQANQRAIAALGEYNSINRDLTHLSVQHGFDRFFDPALQREDMRAREDSLARQQVRLGEIEAEARDCPANDVRDAAGAGRGRIRLAEPLPAGIPRGEVVPRIAGSQAEPRDGDGRSASSAREHGATDRLAREPTPQPTHVGSRG